MNIGAAIVFHGIPAGGSSTTAGLIFSSGDHSRRANIFPGSAVAVVVFSLDNLVELITMLALAGLAILSRIPVS